MRSEAPLEDNVAKVRDSTVMPAACSLAILFFVIPEVTEFLHA